MPVVRPKVGINILVGATLEILAADFQGDHFFIAERGGKPAPADTVAMGDNPVAGTDQAIHGDDKIVAIHWFTPSLNGWRGDRYSTKVWPSGSAA